MVKKTEFTDYIKTFTDILPILSIEKKELTEELEQHLEQLMFRFIEQGHTKAEAVKLAMEQFGPPEKLLPEYQKSHISSWKKRLGKEAFIWFICLAAASLGPALLINAQYTPLFVVAPMLFLIACSLLFHGIIQSVRRTIWWVPLFLLSYGIFMWHAIPAYSFNMFLEEFVTLRLGGDGLATLSIIHLLWVSVLLRYLNKGWRGLAHVSFEYWTMLILAFYMARAEFFMNSGEGKVLLINVFLLYVFFQHMIESKMFVKVKNKMKHLVQERACR